MSDGNSGRGYELPEDLQPVLKKAKRLEWLTIAYMFSSVVFLALVLGQSQAMKAAWVDDLLGLLPPTAFLIASRIREREASGKFPWGQHRSVSIAYLTASFALLIMGVYIFLDSAMKLASGEHAPIGVIPLFGHEIWLGWVMLVALFYSGAPNVFLGLSKRKLADKLHDKVLYADAEMNRADWMTVAAAMLGVIGIGLGLWWMDSVAALFISQDIVRDGWRNVRASTHDLMDARPRTHDNSQYHPVVDDMEREAETFPWVRQARVRLREEGHVFTGEVVVVPEDGEVSPEQLDEATDRLTQLDWKVHDLSVVPVEEIHIPDPEEAKD